MDNREFSAKTIEEAITQACLEFGITSDKLEYEVVQEPSGGFFGIGSHPAVIRAGIKSEDGTKADSSAVSVDNKEKIASDREASVAGRVITNDEIEKRAAEAAAKAASGGKSDTYRDRDEGRGGRSSHRSYDSGRRVRREPSRPKPERAIKARTEEEADELKGAARVFLEDVFKAMDIKADITTEYDETEGAVNCIFAGDEMGLLIGKRGQTLDSLQYLTSLVVNRRADEYVRVKLDTEDYRSRRADTLGNLAKNIAHKVKKTRRPVALEPMNPYERRIIHSSLQGNNFVETYSEGDEPYRHVVVVPKR